MKTTLLFFSTLFLSACGPYNANMPTINCPLTMGAKQVTLPVRFKTNGFVPDDVSIIQAAAEVWNQTFVKQVVIIDNDDLVNTHPFVSAPPASFVPGENAFTSIVFIFPFITSYMILMNTSFVKNMGEDLESIAIHEMGHSLGLIHNPNPSSVMFAYIEPGQVKRVLDQDSINAVNCLYAK